MASVGKLLVIFGVILIALGVLLQFANRIPWFGRLPGDILVEKKNFTFYFPVTTSIIVSVILSLIVWLWSRR